MKQPRDMDNTVEIIEAYADHTPAVYLIISSDSPYCKIGKSNAPWYRLRVLDSPRLPFSVEIASIVRTGPKADAWVEKELHKFFKKRKIRGEWFSCIGEEEFTRKAKALLKTFKRRNDDPKTEKHLTQPVS